MNKDELGDLIVDTEYVNTLVRKFGTMSVADQFLWDYGDTLIAALRELWDNTSNEG